MLSHLLFQLLWTVCKKYCDLDLTSVGARANSLCFSFLLPFHCHALMQTNSRSTSDQKSCLTARNGNGVLSTSDLTYATFVRVHYKSHFSHANSSQSLTTRRLPKALRRWSTCIARSHRAAPSPRSVPFDVNWTVT